MRFSSFMRISCCFLPCILVSILAIPLHTSAGPGGQEGSVPGGLQPVVVQTHAFAESPALLRLAPAQPVVAPTGDGMGRSTPLHYFRRSLKAQGPLPQVYP